MSRDRDPMEVVTTTAGIVLWLMVGVVAQGRFGALQLDT
jgi:hypothetical protein